MNKRIEFDSSQMVAMAKFIAALKQLKVEFEVKNLCGGWAIVIL